MNQQQSVFVVAAVSSPFVFASILTEFNERRIRQRLLSGASVPDLNSTALGELEVARETDVDMLRKEIESMYGSFVLVQGPYMQGKTVLVQQALRKMDNRARIYIEAPESGTLSKLAIKIGQAMNYDANSRFCGPPTNLSLSNNWNLYEDKLVEIAKEHQREGKKPLILVIDNVNTMVQKDRDMLQSFAREMADQKLIVVVFVSSADKAFQMRGPCMDVIQAKDISLDQAKATLIKVVQAARSKRGLTSKGGEQRQGGIKSPSVRQEIAGHVDQVEPEVQTFAEKIVCNFTGGRVGMVHQAALELQSLFKYTPQMSLEEAEQSVRQRLVNQLVILVDLRFSTPEAYVLMEGLLEKHRNLPEYQRRDIVGNARLTLHEAAALNGLNPALVRELCTGTMFWLRYDKDGEVVCFQSAYAATLAKEWLATSKPSGSLAKSRQAMKAWYNWPST